MSDPSSSSFIPKRGPVKRKSGAGSKHIYIFTIVSYVMMFAALLSTGGVYLYGNYIDKQLQIEITALNTEISSFSKANLKKVIDFDSRLNQASTRLNNTVSIVSVFELLELATVGTVKIESLELSRIDDEKIILNASIETDNFDSTIFQRDVYEGNQGLVSVVFSDVNYSANGGLEDITEKDQESQESQESASFTAELEVPLSVIPYVVETIDQPIVITDISEGSVQEVDTGLVDNNEENI